MDTIKGLKATLICKECIAKALVTCHKCGGTGEYEAEVDVADLFSDLREQVRWIAQEEAREAVRYEKEGGKYY